MYKIRASNLKKHLVGDFSLEVSNVRIDDLADRLKVVVDFLKKDGEEQFRIYVEPCVELTGK